MQRICLLLPGLPRVVLALSMAAAVIGNAPAEARQVTPEPPRQTTHASQAPDEQGAPDADELPVSIDRIRRKLGERPPTSGSGLKLQYYIEVYGKAPPINLLEGFNLTEGPVPWSGPTHQELIDVVTPKEFRTPAADLSALIEWLRRRGQR